MCHVMNTDDVIFEIKAEKLDVTTSSVYHAILHKEAVRLKNEKIN